MGKGETGAQHQQAGGLGPGEPLLPGPLHLEPPSPGPAAPRAGPREGDHALAVQTLHALARGRRAWVRLRGSGGDQLGATPCSSHYRLAPGNDAHAESADKSPGAHLASSSAGQTTRAYGGHRAVAASSPPASRLPRPLICGMLPSFPGHMAA